MRYWDRLVFGRLGLVIAIVGTLALPVAGVVMLRFLLTGPPVQTLPPTPSAAVAPAPAPAPEPVAADPANLPTVLPRLSPTPASTPTATPAPTATPSPTPAAVVNATDGLNLRTEPSTRSRVIRILPYQSEPRLSGRQRQSEGLTWVELEEGGWVQERFLDR